MSKFGRVTVTTNSQLAWFSTYKIKHKTNNIILKLHRLKAMAFDKASQWSISQNMIKEFIISYSCLL